MRRLEKISFSQFCKDICDDKSLYDEYNLPRRATMKSAGYDFYAIDDFVIHPGEVLRVPTGVKVIMNDDEAFMLYVRSSMWFKYNVRMTNQVGVIDADYYNNEDNEGHIFIKLTNDSYDDNKTLVIKKGEAIAQGVIVQFFVAEGSESENKREGGIGSTNGK